MPKTLYHPIIILIEYYYYDGRVDDYGYYFSVQSTINDESGLGFRENERLQPCTFEGDANNQKYVRNYRFKSFTRMRPRPSIKTLIN